MAKGNTLSVSLNELSEEFARADKQAIGIAKHAVFEAARVVADALAASVDTIKTEPFKFADDTKGETRLPSPQEKAALGKSFAGIARFYSDAISVDTSVGLAGAGYTHIKGAGRKEDRADGQTSSDRKIAIAELARSIESGTSFMKKQPFMRKAFAGCKAAAESAMEKAVAERLDQLFK